MTLQPGYYFYTDDIIRDLVKRSGERFEPLPVQVREVDPGVLGVFFEGRQDYDLLEEVSGHFEPVLGGAVR